MSGTCKVVKGLSLLAILYGLVQIVVGATCFFRAADAASVTIIDDPVSWARVLGVVLAVSGVYLVITGLAGARGANRPSKLMPFIVLATIFTFVSLFTLAMAIGESTVPVLPSILQSVVGFVGIIFASRAKKEAEA